MLNQTIVWGLSNPQDIARYLLEFYALAPSRQALWGAPRLHVVVMESSE